MKNPPVFYLIRRAHLLETEDLYIRNLLQSIAEHDDKRAFTIFFDRYYTRLIRFALLYVPVYSQAEDVVSEVLVRLVRRRRELVKIDNFQGYLFRAVKHEALNQIKVQRRQSPAGYRVEDISDYFQPDVVDPCEQLLEKELRSIISRIVEALPPKRQMVYKLVKDEGLRQKEVAALLDISERTVEEHLKLAVRELRGGVRQYFAERRVEDKGTYMRVMRGVLTLLMI